MTTQQFVCKGCGASKSVNNFRHYDLEARQFVVGALCQACRHKIKPHPQTVKKHMLPKAERG